MRLMARILEARLTDDFTGSSEITGMIHSRFRTVLNILFRMPARRDRLITVITPDTRGIPDSITVEKEYFSKISMLPVGSGLLYENLTIRFEGLSEPLVGGIQCLRQSGLVIDSGDANGFRLPDLLRYIEELDGITAENRRVDGHSVWDLQRSSLIAQDLQKFSGEWVKGDAAEMESILLKYTGLGIGLTPSCDDAFLGMIAVFSGAKLYAGTYADQIGKSLKAWRDLPSAGSLTPFDRLLRNRTTDVSLKYLCCSQEGRFSDVVADLIRAVFSGSRRNLRACIEAASLVGESSGMDMLFGTKIACRELEKSLREV